MPEHDLWTGDVTYVEMADVLAVLGHRVQTRSRNMLAVTHVQGMQVLQVPRYGLQGAVGKGRVFGNIQNF